MLIGIRYSCFHFLLSAFILRYFCIEALHKTVLSKNKKWHIFKSAPNANSKWQKRTVSVSRLLFFYRLANYTKVSTVQIVDGFLKKLFDVEKWKISIGKYLFPKLTWKIYVTIFCEIFFWKKWSNYTEHWWLKFVEKRKDWPRKSFAKMIVLFCPLSKHYLNCSRMRCLLLYEYRRRSHYAARSFNSSFCICLRAHVHVYQIAFMLAMLVWLQKQQPNIVHVYSKQLAIGFRSGVNG